ncbi:MAG: zinc ribbon domain-containing protein [Ignavibacteria bacterium]|jgi:putative FmdB family regulatory protein
MPTYDYVCTNCGYQFEEFQKMSDDPLTECPVCKGKLKRLIGTGLSPIFKGSGFYETDYKKDTKKQTRENKSTETPKKTENKKDNTKEKPAA